MANWSYEDTGLATDALVINSITATPDPLATGRTNVFTINATAQAEIADGAYLDVTIKLGLIKLLTKRYDLFTQLRGAGDLKLTCETSDGKSPIPKGDTTLTLTMDFPKEIPRAKFNLTVQGYTADEDDLLSLKAQVNFLPSL
ncbi:ML domain-containing protein [Kitasatospora sp. NPDC097643]|uniref:ML domain-containing protein n=1 Tax=Kitasatospora sp. NPDC097643 TaxID=3157230 RepID=UPI0033340591